MRTETKKISRLELYKQVWEIPVTRLAKEYGLSDVGFAKICKKFNIPRPERGYWARKVSGQRVQPVPLPNRSRNELIEIRPNLSNRLGAAVEPKFMQSMVFEKKFPPIVVAKVLRDPHPIVRQSAEILELCQPNEVGILEPKNKNCLDIRVSRASLRRALRIMDSLIKGLIARGHEIDLKKGVVLVRIEDESLGFGISEELMTQKNEPKDLNLDGAYQFRHSHFEYDRLPSGTLCLKINDEDYFWGAQFRKNWRDTKRKRLEDNLDTFILGLFKRVAQKKEYRRQKEEEARQREEIVRQREEERQRREELAQRIQQERQRVAQLIQDAENFSKSKQLGEFIDYVQNERQRGNFPYVEEADFESWVRWARDQADRLNPLVKSPASVLDQDIEESVSKGNECGKIDPYFNKW